MYLRSYWSILLFLELVMGIADKIKSSKDNRVKVKRIRFGNVKDFHGRRQHGENILVHEGI